MIVPDTKWLPKLSGAGRSKYKALAEAIREGIVSGQLPAGAKLPPVRDLAYQVGVTPGTVARAYSLMTNEGTMWREFAVALGRVGSSAVMPLVARIGSSGQRGQARAVWALGYMALGGASKSVETLAKEVASASLELRERLRTDSVKVERISFPPFDQSLQLF